MKRGKEITELRFGIDNPGNCVMAIARRRARIAIKLGQHFLQHADLKRKAMTD